MTLPTSPGPSDDTLCFGCFAEPRGATPCKRCGYLDDPDEFPTALRSGTALRSFRIGRVLGRPGGFGITYLAWDPTLRRRLAVKELMPRGLVSRRADGESVHVQSRQDGPVFRQTLESFLDEARIVAQLSHRHIVRIVEFFEANGTAYLAMDYHDGETLAEAAARRGGRLEPTQAVATMLPILDALHHAHGQASPVIHRDVKPANIYMVRREEPVLLDFGAARVLMSQKSASLSAILTPGFAPPEQYSPRGRQGPWTDVYGCAATLYSLIVGTPPPEPTGPEHPTHTGAALAFPADVSPQLADTITRGLAQKPEDRPTTMAEFSAMLRGTLVAGSRTTVVTPAVTTPAGTLSPGASGPTGVRRSHLVAGAIAAVVLVAAAAFFSSRGDEQRVGETAQLLSTTVPDAGTTGLNPIIGEPSATPRPAPPVTRPAPPSRVPVRPEVRGVLVSIQGNDTAGVRRAEAGLLGSITTTAGLQAIDSGAHQAAARRAVAGGNYGALRGMGAHVLVLGELTVDASPSVGKFFTGTATLTVKAYTPTGMLNAATFDVGGTSPGKLGPSADAARSAAVQHVIDEALEVIGGWLERRDVSTERN